MTDNLPQICLGIVQNANKEVLIVQRAKEEKGTSEVKLSWAFPGGTLENGESKEETVTRELLEETGYKVNVISVISERQHPQFPVYIYYLECILEQNNPVGTPQDEDIKQIKWVSSKDIRSYFSTNLDPKVKKYLGL